MFEALSSHGRASSRSPALSVIASYAVDWVGTLLLAGLLAIINSVPGFRREFSLTDTSIQHTYTPTERVPTWLLAVCAFVVPLGIIAVVSLAVRRSWWDFHTAFLGLVLTNALTLTITTLVKVTVGRPRPDLISRCQPQAGASNAPVFGLVTQAICTTPVTDHIIRDGFRSFPSGHASTSFAGLTFLSLYLAGKFHLFDSRGHALGAWITLTPLVGATLITITRTEDYRHHATDVIAGGLLGFWISVAIYLMYYPPLGHAQSHKPWAPRLYQPFAKGGAFDRFDDESAERPTHTGGHGAHGVLHGVLGSGPEGAHAEEEAYLRGGNAYAPQAYPTHSRDGSAANALETATLVNASSKRAGAPYGYGYGPGAGASPSAGMAEVPPPTHATGPRTPTHGYAAPVYVDAATIGRGAPGGQGKEDVAYHPEFASRPYRGAGRPDEVELGTGYARV